MAKYEQVSDWEWCAASNQFFAMFRSRDGRLAVANHFFMERGDYNCRPLPPRPVTDAEIVAAVRDLDERRVHVEVRDYGYHRTPSEGETLPSFLVRIAKELP